MMMMIVLLWLLFSCVVFKLCVPIVLVYVCCMHCSVCCYSVLSLIYAMSSTHDCVIQALCMTC